MEHVLLIAIVLAGIVLPFGLWVVHENRRRARERIAAEIADYYRLRGTYEGPDLVQWADPRRPASSRPD